MKSPLKVWILCFVTHKSVSLTISARLCHHLNPQLKKFLKIMNVKKLEEEMRKIQGGDLQLPLSVYRYAIWYLKKEEENKRCSEMDNTQPLLNDFISGDSQLLKREELVKDNDHISNGRFSDKNNKLDTERNEEKPLNGLSMLLKTTEVEIGLGLGLTSSLIVNGGRRTDIASCGFTSDYVPLPPQFLQQQALRKQRRCWNPELHHRFVDALQQLGGPGGTKTIHLLVLEIFILAIFCGFLFIY